MPGKSKSILCFFSALISHCHHKFGPLLYHTSNFISRVWPRASAVAERLWTGDVTVGGAKQTVSDRIHRFRCLMVQVGISASPTGPGVCPHEVPYNTVSATESFTAELDTNAII